MWLEIPELDITQAPIKLHASAIRIDNFSTKPSLQATVNLEQFNPSRLAQAWNFKIPRVNDKSALQRLALQFHLQFDGDSVAVYDLAGQLDDSHFSGDATFKNPAKPEITFDLQVDNIQLDRYLPIPEHRRPNLKSRSQRLTITIPNPPDERLIALNANGQIRFDNLVSNGVSLKKARLAIKSGKN